MIRVGPASRFSLSMFNHEVTERSKAAEQCRGSELGFVLLDFISVSTYLRARQQKKSKTHQLRYVGTPISPLRKLRSSRCSYSTEVQEVQKIETFKCLFCESYQGADVFFFMSDCHSDSKKRLKHKSLDGKSRPRCMSHDNSRTVGMRVSSDLSSSATVKK